MCEIDLEELAQALQEEFGLPEKKQGRTAREERIISGFEEIQQFVRQHKRLPQSNEQNSIFERIYAIRLNTLRSSEECRQLLQELDVQMLLKQDHEHADIKINEDKFLSELSAIQIESDITHLTLVRRHTERFTPPDYIANRQPCTEFDQFAPLFEQVKQELKHHNRETRPFNKQSGIRLNIEQGDWFILGGQTAYVAESGEEFDSPQGKKDARLRVIFSNKTESHLLRLSLVRALYKDNTARRITAPHHDLPLFSEQSEENDMESGTLYVLRSQSNHPFIQEHRTLIHKIGVTGGKVLTRIADAEKDATFLLAKVEVVAEYKLSNINRRKLETMLHQFFANAQLNITLHDRFGHPVQPKEWFFLPLDVIDQTIKAIIDGSITHFVYDPKTVQLTRLPPHFPINEHKN